MVNYQRILVPVDFSDQSMDALRFAIGLAHTTNAQIEVLHVWEPPAYVGPEMMVMLSAEAPERPIAELARSEISKTMQHFLGTLDEESGLEIIGRLEIGSPSNSILKRSVDGAHDVIVMATHGRRGLPRLLIGSVAEKVVRLSHCPVVTIHRDPSETSDSGAR